jgi:hypothetical protein
MELGGAEPAPAARRLGDPRAKARLAQAATWAGLTSARSPTPSCRGRCAVTATAPGKAFEDGLDDYVGGMRECPPDGSGANARFTGHGSRYLDDARSWQTSEPADDFTALGLHALTLTATEGGH